MVFSSQLFLFWFLPAVLAAYYLTPRRGKQLTLTLFSYVFYGWANPALIFLLLGSTLLDWTAGLILVGVPPWSRREIEVLPRSGPRNRRQRIALAVTVTSNLS